MPAPTLDLSTTATAIGDLRGNNGWFPGGNSPDTVNAQLNFTGTVAGVFNAGKTGLADSVPSSAIPITVHTATNTIRLPWKISANTEYEVYWQLVTAEGATCTMTIATDESTPVTVLSGANANGTPGKMLGCDGSTGGVATLFRTSTADCYLVLTINHTTNNAVVNVSLTRRATQARLTA